MKIKRIIWLLLANIVVTLAATWSWAADQSVSIALLFVTPLFFFGCLLLAGGLALFRSSWWREMILNAFLSVPVLWSVYYLAGTVQERHESYFFGVYRLGVWGPRFCDTLSFYIDRPEGFGSSGVLLGVGVRIAPKEYLLVVDPLYRGNNLLLIRDASGLVDTLCIRDTLYIKNSYLYSSPRDSLKLEK